MTEWTNVEPHTIAEFDIAMTHVAIQEKFDGKVIAGIAQVSDEHCRQRSSAGDIAAQRKDDNVEKHVSRRGFLKSGAIALGSVAVCKVGGIAGAAQAIGAKPMVPGELKESAMPHVIIKMYPGRSEQQKRQLADAIVKDVVAIAGGSEDSVSVAIEEIPAAEWTEKVYKPDVLKNWDKLYKKPGY